MTKPRTVRLKRVGFYLTIEQIRALRHLAVDHDMDASQYLREHILKPFLEKLKPQK